MIRFRTLTPPGRGAVAVVECRGEFAPLDASGLFHAANGMSLCDQPLGRIVFGHWGTDAREDVVVSWIDTQTLEICCHGGDAARARIERDLAALGATAGDGIAPDHRANSLTQAPTWRTFQYLWNSAAPLKAALQELASRPSRAELDTLLRWSEFGIHLTQPWRVVIAGRPNVGKSTLMNALLGYGRSIVSPIPGTTRDVVSGETAFSGWPVSLSDTAGFRASTDEIEMAGIGRAELALTLADLCLLVVDASDPDATTDLPMVDAKRSLVVVNKCDLIPSETPSDTGRAQVSALTGAGIAGLIERIVLKLVPEIPAPGTPIPICRLIVERLQAAREHLERGNEDVASDILHSLTESSD